MSPTKYRKKPVVIEAMQYGPTPTDAHTLTSWMEANLYVGLVGNALDPDSLRYPDQIEGDDSTPNKGWYIDPADGALMIRTLEGDMRTAPGDYVIRGVKGEFYPCKPEIFAATYEPATPASSDSAPDQIPAELVEKVLETRLPSGGLPPLNEPQVRTILAAVLRDIQAQALRDAAYALRTDEAAYGGNRAVLGPPEGASWLLRRAARLTETTEETNDD